MNDFFKLSDGTKPEVVSSFDGGGGAFDPIPAKTVVLAIADEVRWYKPDDGLEVISVRWTVLQPVEYKNRKVFQKLKINDDEPKVYDKARRMLSAIDQNAGGELMKLDRRPTDTDLARALINKPMMLMLQEWDYQGKQGNWVSAVSPKGSQEAARAPNVRSDKRPKTENNDTAF